MMFIVGPICALCLCGWHAVSVCAGVLGVYVCLCEYVCAYVVANTCMFICEPVLDDIFRLKSAILAAQVLH